GSCSFFPGLPQVCPGPSLERDALSDGVQPARERLTSVERAGPAGQDQKRGLEGFFGVMEVAEHAPADGKYHGPIALDENGGRRLVFAVHKPGQQLTVRHTARSLSAKRAAQITQNLLQR